MVKQVENVKRNTFENLEAPDYVWKSGKFIPWDKATFHISMLGWSSINMVFEGIRAYYNENDDQVYVLHLNEHLNRLTESMKMMRMHPYIKTEKLKEVILELIRKNKYRADTYIMPLAYFGDGPPGFLPSGDRLGDMAITVKPIDSLLTSDNTLNVGVSSWRRISDDVMPPRIKSIANYQNGRYAAEEARINGYDQSLILNSKGKVAESTYTCVFMIKNKTLITPSVTSGILDSITRKSIIEISKNELGLNVEERDVDRTEFYVSDESFICGTGGEVQFIGKIDGYTIGKGTPGIISKEIQTLYHNLVRGLDHRYHHWRTPTY